jgi:Fe-S cluster biogenesis protein NfuA
MQKIISKFDWILLPGGKKAILRFPLRGDLSSLEKPVSGKYRLATHDEVVVMNYGAPYPWGFMQENNYPTKLWKEKRIGYGGLVHDAWFVLENDERIGGAPNVPEIGPGAQRHYLLTTGGIDNSHLLNENEGFAVVWDDVPTINDKIYQTIHSHVSKHVTADRGGVIISPITEECQAVFVGFIGRCMTCPNPERISINALKDSCKEINIELHPDWKEWSI